jgi:predicted Zn-dependent protease
VTSQWSGRALALGAVVLALSCAAAPYTKRSQLMLVSDGEAAKMGAQAFGEVLKEGNIVQTGPAVDQVHRVGSRIARVADIPNAQWQFAVIDDPKQANAFALPGGKVAVYTGILPITQDDTGLAVVLGHEIGHVLERHGAERMSQGLVAQLGGTALAVAMGGGPSTSAVLAAYGLGAQYGVLNPFSRTQESEADHVGLILMAKAGYDPRDAVAFWERMEQSGGKSPPEFLSTHPSHGTRVEQIRAELPEALQYYQASGAAAAR